MEDARACPIEIPFPFPVPLFLLRRPADGRPRRRRSHLGGARVGGLRPERLARPCLRPYFDAGSGNVSLTDVANNYGTKFFTRRVRRRPRLSVVAGARAVRAPVADRRHPRSRRRRLRVLRRLHLRHRAHRDRRLLFQPGGGGSADRERHHHLQPLARRLRHRVGLPSPTRPASTVATRPLPRCGVGPPTTAAHCRSPSLSPPSPAACRATA
ncbi:hypothetical protein ACRAWF_32045 [Streptomyces sp. L7]